MKWRKQLYAEQMCTDSSSSPPNLRQLRLSLAENTVLK
jgi:hypothetical protein